MQEQLSRQLKEINQTTHRYDSMLTELQRSMDRLTKN